MSDIMVICKTENLVVKPKKSFPTLVMISEGLLCLISKVYCADSVYCHLK